jgi:hypothetical protein
VILSNEDGAGGVGRSNLLVDPSGIYTSFVGGATTNSGRTFSPDQFDHLILTYDPAGAGGATLRFYVNGQPAGTSTLTPEFASGNWLIGANKNRAVQFFAGVIDEIAIYDKRLDDPNGDDDESDSRVTAHFREFVAESDTLIDFASDFAYRDSGQSAVLSWQVSPALTL